VPWENSLAVINLLQSTWKAYGIEGMMFGGDGARDDKKTKKKGDAEQGHDSKRYRNPNVFESELTEVQPLLGCKDDHGRFGANNKATNVVEPSSSS
jgi:hypothetical protein